MVVKTAEGQSKNKELLSNGERERNVKMQSQYFNACEKIRTLYMAVKIKLTV